MTFQLDTTGTVDANEGQHIDLDGQLYIGVGWGILSPFTQGYIEALFASNLNLGGNRTDEALCAFRDLAPETLARIIADCDVMRGRLGGRFADSLSDPTEEGAGRAFWKLRQKSLYADFPPLTVQLGDDGKVVFA